MNWKGLLCRGTAALCALLLTGVPRVEAAEEPVHVLLIGVDRAEQQGPGRSDAVLLCSFLPEQGRIVLTSFLRDLYIPIPGHGRNRLNAAYALGGRKLLERTLEERFGLELRGSVEVDFSRFPKLIDKLGGVELELRADEAERINKSCPGSALCQGLTRLNGEQALCYARLRTLDADGDFSRTGRQQKILRCLLAQWQQAEAGALLEMLPQLTQMVSTDLSPVEILGWIFQMAPARDRLCLSSARIPAPGTYRFRTIRGMAVLEADWEENTAALHRALDKGLAACG